MTEPQTNARRGFLKVVFGACSAGIAAAVAVPGVAYLLDPLIRHTKAVGGFFSLGSVKDLRTDTPTAVPVIGELVDQWMRAPEQMLGTVWLRKGKDDGVVALSAECPHLGCRVNYDEAKKNFQCPCHNSAFSLDGTVLYGPCARAMDTLEAKVEGGQVKVRFQRFQTQIKEKIEVG